MLALIALPVLLAACGHSTSASGTDDPAPSDVVNSLGAVPIPSATAAESTPSAVPGHPALLAIGGPVDVTLPDASRALVTALGPAQAVTAPPSGATAGPPPQSTRAVITLRVKSVRGSWTFGAGELSSRDDTGRLITLTPQGPATAVAGAGTTALVRVAGTFTSGAAQVTWRHGGHVLAVWTFNIELD